VVAPQATGEKHLKLIKYVTHTKSHLAHKTSTPLYTIPNGTTYMYNEMQFQYNDQSPYILLHMNQKYAGI
jgi:hypothetical protein